MKEERNSNSSEMIEISREEYEKLKKIEDEAYQNKEGYHQNIYDKVNVSVHMLDAIILVGIGVIIVAIILGIVL